MDQIFQLIIIGGGPAGLTAATYAGRAALSPLLLTGEMPGGLLSYTSRVENFPGFPEGIQGSELVTRMLHQAERSGARIEFEKADQIQFSSTPHHFHTVTSSNGQTWKSRTLILAMGATPRKLNVPGEERLYGHGVSSCATCDGAFFRHQPVAVAGGGDSAAEEALYLASFTDQVTLLFRGEELTASSVMRQRVQANAKIILRPHTVPVEILGEANVSGLTVQDTLTRRRETFAVSGIFTAIGNVPQTRLVAASLPCDPAGYLQTHAPSTATICPGVFACGDCTDPVYRQAVTAAAGGCRAALDARRYLETEA